MPEFGGDRRIAKSGPITVVPATAEYWSALVQLFTSTSGRNGCWCIWPRRARGQYRNGDSGNREAMRMLVTSTEPPGLIALVGERAVGWCAVGPRRNYPQYEGAPDDGAWAIPCLSLEDDVRGTRVARMLVESAVSHAAARGAKVLEGPPSYWFAGAQGVVAAARQAFLSCGFVEVGAGVRMPLLRRHVSQPLASV